MSSFLSRIRQHNDTIGGPERYADDGLISLGVLRVPKDLDVQAPTHNGFRYYPAWVVASLALSKENFSGLSESEWQEQVLAYLKEVQRSVIQQQALLMNYLLITGEGRARRACHVALARLRST